MTYNSGVVTFFRDGVQVEVISADGLTSMRSARNLACIAGSPESDDKMFRGFLAEVGIILIGCTGQEIYVFEYF